MPTRQHLNMSTWAICQYVSYIYMGHISIWAICQYVPYANMCHISIWAICLYGPYANMCHISIWAIYLMAHGSLCDMSIWVYKHIHQHSLLLVSVSKVLEEAVSEIFSSMWGRLLTDNGAAFTVLVSAEADILGTSIGGSEVNSFLSGEGGIDSSMLTLEWHILFVPLVCLWTKSN